MQIRRLTRADIDAAAELTARVFAQGVAEQRAAFELARAASLHCPFMPPELCWGVFDEADTLVAKWQLVDLSVRVLGVPLRTAGSFAIAAEPAVRGDVVQRMVEAGRAEVSELGFDLMIGVAQRGAIYQRLGARPICAEPLWELDPLHVPAPRAGERFHAPFPEQLPWSIDTYLASNAARSGTLQRSAELLAFLPRRAPEMLAVEAGYLGLRVAAGDPASDIEVREVAAVDDAFYDAALRELAERARAAGARRVFGHVPADHPLVLASAIYGARVTVEHPRRSGCMAGLVDPARALEKLTPVLRARFAASAFREQSIVLEVATADRKHRIALGSSASPSQTIALELSPGALAQLLFGYLPARTLLAAEGAALPSAPHAAILDALFEQPAPFVWHTDRF